MAGGGITPPRPTGRIIMFILVLMQYKSKKVGVEWQAGQVMEVDQETGDFLKRDAPDCFHFLHPDLNEDARALIQEVAQGGDDEEILEMVKFLDKAGPEEIKGLMESIKAEREKEAAKAQDDPDGDDPGTEEQVWDDLTVDDLKGYLEAYPEGARPAKKLKKKGDIIAFIETDLGIFVIPLDQVAGHFTDQVIQK